MAKIGNRLIEARWEASLAGASVWRNRWTAIRIFGVLIPLSLTGCGNSDERALDRMIRARVGPEAYLRISDVFVYREGDAKRACLQVQRRNHWGEALPAERVFAWYVWNSQSWHFDNFHAMRDRRPCAEVVASAPTEQAPAAEQQRGELNQQITNFLADDQMRLDEGTRELEARATEER